MNPLQKAITNYYSELKRRKKERETKDKLIEIMLDLANNFAESERQNGIMRQALEDISSSGPVDIDGNDDPEAGWSWCYDRAEKALREVNKNDN